MSLSTHILDTSRGTPAANVPIVLEFLSAPPNTWQRISAESSNADGRCPVLVPTGHALAAGTYRLTFDTTAYFGQQKQETFYPRVEILFTLKNPAQHYHVPLLLSPWGYSTYRGS
jgi:5-hydroxyisourate hydrolase